MSKEGRRPWSPRQGYYHRQDFKRNFPVETERLEDHNFFKEERMYRSEMSRGAYSSGASDQERRYGTGGYLTARDNNRYYGRKYSPPSDRQFHNQSNHKNRSRSPHRRADTSDGERNSNGRNKDRQDNRSSSRSPSVRSSLSHHKHKSGHNNYAERRPLENSFNSHKQKSRSSNQYNSHENSPRMERRDHCREDSGSSSEKKSFVGRQSDDRESRSSKHSQGMRSRDTSSSVKTISANGSGSNYSEVKSRKSVGSNDNYTLSSGGKRETVHDNGTVKEKSSKTHKIQADIGEGKKMDKNCNNVHRNISDAEDKPSATNVSIVGGSLKHGLREKEDGVKSQSCNSEENQVQNEKLVGNMGSSNKVNESEIHFNHFRKAMDSTKMKIHETSSGKYDSLFDTMSLVGIKDRPKVPAMGDSHKAENKVETTDKIYAQKKDDNASECLERNFSTSKSKIDNSEKNGNNLVKLDKTNGMNHDVKCARSHNDFLESVIDQHHQMLDVCKPEIRANDKQIMTAVEEVSNLNRRKGDSHGFDSVNEHSSKDTLNSLKSKGDLYKEPTKCIGNTDEQTQSLKNCHSNEEPCYDYINGKSEKKQNVSSSLNNGNSKRQSSSPDEISTSLEKNTSVKFKDRREKVEVKQASSVSKECSGNDETEEKGKLKTGRRAMCDVKRGPDSSKLRNVGALNRTGMVDSICMSSKTDKVDARKVEVCGAVVLDSIMKNMKTPDYNIIHSKLDQNKTHTPGKEKRRSDGQKQTNVSRHAISTESKSDAAEMLGSKPNVRCSLAESNETKDREVQMSDTISKYTEKKNRLNLKRKDSEDVPNASCKKARIDQETDSDLATGDMGMKREVEPLFKKNLRRISHFNKLVSHRSSCPAVGDTNLKKSDDKTVDDQTCTNASGQMELNEDKAESRELHVTETLRQEKPTVVKLKIPVSKQGHSTLPPPKKIGKKPIFKRSSSENAPTESKIELLGKKAVETQYLEKNDDIYYDSDTDEDDIMPIEIGSSGWSSLEDQSQSSNKSVPANENTVEVDKTVKVKLDQNEFKERSSLKEHEQLNMNSNQQFGSGDGTQIMRSPSIIPKEKAKQWFEKAKQCLKLPKDFCNAAKENSAGLASSCNSLQMSKVQDGQKKKTNVMNTGFAVCHVKVLSDGRTMKTNAHLHPNNMNAKRRCLQCTVCSCYFTPLAFTVHHDTSSVVNMLDQKKCQENGYTAEDPQIIFWNKEAEEIFDEFQDIFQREKCAKLQGTDTTEADDQQKETMLDSSDTSEQSCHKNTQKQISVQPSMAEIDSKEIQEQTPKVHSHQQQKKQQVQQENQLLQQQYTADKTNQCLEQQIDTDGPMKQGQKPTPTQSLKIKSEQGKTLNSAKQNDTQDMLRQDFLHNKPQQDKICRQIQQQPANQQSQEVLKVLNQKEHCRLFKQECSHQLAQQMRQEKESIQQQELSLNQEYPSIQKELSEYDSLSAKSSSSVIPEAAIDPEFVSRNSDGLEVCVWPTEPIVSKSIQQCLSSYAIQKAELPGIGEPASVTSSHEDINHQGISRTDSQTNVMPQEATDVSSKIRDDFDEMMCSLYGISSPDRWLNLLLLSRKLMVKAVENIHLEILNRVRTQNGSQ